MAQRRRLSHDARGNLASKLRAGGVAVTAGYDGQGRLIRYARDGEAALVFAYNGLDDRVLETRTLAGGNAVTRRYVYDAGGRLLGEYGANARAVIAEHIWLLPSAANDNRLVLGGDEAGYQPLAVAQGSVSGSTATTLRWLHGSHLGAPLLQTTASGAPLAASGYTLGAYPGQWRTLDDVHYNRHRDYDPTTGRYLQADPIGLAGGDNPYLYAEGNPLTRIDPSGLVAPLVIAGVCGGGGCEAALIGGIGLLYWAFNYHANLPDDYPTFPMPALDAPYCPPALFRDNGNGRGGGRGGFGNPPRDDGDDGDDFCEKRYKTESRLCRSNYGKVWGYDHFSYQGCISRAKIRLDMCNRGLEPPPRWSDRDVTGEPPIRKRGKR